MVLVEHDVSSYPLVFYILIYGVCVGFFTPCSMLESVTTLKKKAKKVQTAESSAFQQLFLLVGMNLFKVLKPSSATLQSGCHRI